MPALRNIFLWAMDLLADAHGMNELAILVLAVLFHHSLSDAHGMIELALLVQTVLVHDGVAHAHGMIELALLIQTVLVRFNLKIARAAIAYAVTVFKHGKLGIQGWGGQNRLDVIELLDRHLAETRWSTFKRTRLRNHHLYHERTQVIISLFRKRSQNRFSAVEVEAVTAYNNDQSVQVF